MTSTMDLDQFDLDAADERFEDPVGTVHVWHPDGVVLKRFTNPTWVDPDRLTEVADRAAAHGAGAVGAWPAIKVVDAGWWVGITMPLAPPRFWAAGGPAGSSLRRFDELVADRTAPADLPTRAALLARLAEAMGAVHEAGIVLGDLAAHSVCWSDDPDPAVFLIGLDSAAVLGRPLEDTVPASSAAAAATGAAGQRFTVPHDLALLALLAVRVLGGDANATLHPASVELPDDPVLERRVRDLVEATAAGRPPAARVWAAALEGLGEGLGSVDRDVLHVDRLLMVGAWQEAVDMAQALGVAHPRLGIALEHLAVERTTRGPQSLVVTGG